MPLHSNCEVYLNDNQEHSVDLFKLIIKNDSQTFILIKDTKLIRNQEKSKL
jgi:hypothetical protein